MSISSTRSFPLTDRHGPGQLSGAVALITGGTSGIGLGVARRMLGEGARVAITGRDRRRGAAAESELGDDAWFIEADATDPFAVQQSVDATLDRFGALDALVNNAGVAVTERLVDTPVDAFDRVMAANVRGPFLYARACFTALAASRGSMIHIGSDAGLRAEQPIGAYSVSKAAVVMMSQVLALDGAAHGVRSNCVCPGATAPGMRHIGPANDPDRGDDPAEWPTAPLGRVGTADDVAGAVVYLASPQASFISGAVLLVDGGNAAGLRADAP
ncbi:MAG TPA: glucose 1-dehydrogenase [Solirubrobacteraceae bacterium]|nr:glucose 1-dehydrogenase [Solirubrobacteraceae bacterium]